MYKPNVLPERLADFKRVYSEEIARAYAEHPGDYMLSVPPETVAERMTDAVARGSANKDGRAFRATLKRLRVKDTYRALNAFLAGEA